MMKDSFREAPDGIIITVGEKMYGKNGYRNWLKNFFEAMKISESRDDWFYWFRQGNQPKASDSLQYVYLCIGGKIRYRCFYAGSYGPGSKKFENHPTEMFGKAWILVAGPIVKAPFVIKRQGFQGFRYTTKLF